jgi:hypothetical protein
MRPSHRHGGVRGDPGCVAVPRAGVRTRNTSRSGRGGELGMRIGAHQRDGPSGGPTAGQPPPPCRSHSGGGRLLSEGIDAGAVGIPGMATPVVEGEVMGCSGGEEVGDAVVIGAGPAAGTRVVPAAAIGATVARGAAGVRAPPAWLCTRGRRATGPPTARASSVAAAPVAPGRAAGRGG